MDTVLVVERALEWSVQDQADEVRCDAYGQALKAKIEATPSRGHFTADALHGDHPIRSHLCSVCLQPKLEDPSNCDSNEHVRWAADQDDMNPRPAGADQ
jgi:hypothetical protein